MSSSSNDEGEKSVTDMKPPKMKTENHEHMFSYKCEKYSVSCNEPLTILKSLQRDSSFKAIYTQNHQGKEIVIRRETHRAAVTLHFPCCLIKNEILEINFIKSDGQSTTVTQPELPTQSAEELVTFYIKTRGDENIRMVMKNQKIKSIMEDVCVYGVKGEKVKAALKRDGRFRSEILRKGALRDLRNYHILNLSNTVTDSLDGNQFRIIPKPHQTDSPGSSLEMSDTSEPLKEEKNEIPEAAQATNSTHDSTNTQEKKTEKKPKAKESQRYPDPKRIPNSEEILKLLREQHADLLKTLKERENLKNDTEEKTFFREEYDKSARSFSEVKRVKELMKFSDLVCQIRNNNSAVGTGFLLFNKFVLTCAHVVGDYNPFTRIMEKKLTAVFGFEDLPPVGQVINVNVEEKIVAVFYGKNKKGSHLDFALLELSSAENVNVPESELLKHYSAPPSRGGVCIIGHPGGNVKQMDPSFMIPKQDRKKAAVEHYERNKDPESLQVISRCCFIKDTEIREFEILYDTCFFHGSSGSPVFDEQCNLIGIHTGGYVYGEEKETRSVMEYALPMLPVLAQIYIRCKYERPDDSEEQKMKAIVEYFEKQNNMNYVFLYANECTQQNVTVINNHP